jgi:hypothetical protein
MRSRSTNTPLSVLRENAWQLVMYILGVILVGMINYPLAGAYLGYSLLSNVLYMALICPYCNHYHLGTCHAGFHLLSRQIFKPQPGRTFAGQFKRFVVVMVPGWFVPPIAGVYLLVRDFSWLALILTALFCLVGFVILPKDSQRHCQDCEMEDCPRRPRR